MSSHTDLGRRQFLKVSALAGGGLLLGVEFVRPRASAAATSAFNPNAWVGVHPDGRVSLVCPRNEMGQDVHTSLTMLLAEELAVDPSHVAIEEAPPNPVYINKLMGSQITGGSTSIRDAWEPLRKAGATARTMLVSAAAARWKVPAAECRASGGHVLHGGNSLAYGAVAADAGAVLAGTKPMEARYPSQMLAHATLEPPNCLALVSSRGVDVWASTQYPQGAQAIAAQTAAVRPEQVRVHPQFIGGGFGRRLDVDFIGQAVAIAKAMPGTPVKLIWTREDDVTHDFYRPPSLHLLSAALGDRRIAAFTHTMISPSITNRLFPGVVKDGIDGFMTEGIVDFTYDIPNLDLRTVIQEVGIRVGYWRSVSNALNALAIESFFDELAHAAGQDPVAFRLAVLGGRSRQLS